MQTIYFETTHFIRHTGNVVDLTEYREKLALARGEELEIPACVRMDETEPVPQPRPRTRRRRRRLTALAADWAASAAIVAMAVAMIVKIL